MKNEWKNKKILFVINNLKIGGAEKLVVDQINFLAKNGITVELLTLILPNKQTFDIRINPVVRRHDFNFNKVNLRAIFKVRNFLKKNNFDIVISHLFFANTLVRLASIFLFSKKPKIIVYEHNVYSKVKKAKHLFIDFVLSFFTDRIIAVSGAVKNYLEKSGINGNRINVVKNGISFDFIGLLKPREKIRKEMGFDDDNILIISVGHINTQKGYEFLIQAAEKIVIQNLNIFFLICGFDDTVYARNLAEEVRLKGLSPNVRFLGIRDDVLDMINAADIFFMPSRWEGLSIALLEAMAMGKAIAASNIDSIAEIIEDGQDGILFETGDIEKIANALRDLTKDVELRRKYGENSATKVKKHSIENNVRNLLEQIS